MKIFNIFPGSVKQSSVLKILSANCSRETVFYVPGASLLINRFFIILANRNDNTCLISDCRSINPNGPGNFRTRADDVEEQQCYFHIRANDELCNTFISKRVRNFSPEIDYIQFKIKRVVSKSKTCETFNATSELRELLDNGTATA